MPPRVAVVIELTDDVVLDRIAEAEHGRREERENAAK